MLSANAEDFLPQTIQLLLRIMFTGKKTNMKLASIGQVLMQATRLRVLLAPRELGLGLQMQHHYSSQSREVLQLYKNTNITTYQGNRSSVEQTTLTTMSAQLMELVLPWHEPHSYQSTGFNQMQARSENLCFFCRDCCYWAYQH